MSVFLKWHLPFNLAHQEKNKTVNFCSFTYEDDADADDDNKDAGDDKSGMA